MDFALSEEQDMLRKSARDFLNTECPKSVVKEIEASDLGYSPGMWRKMAALGWMGIALPEEYEGAGLSLLDLAVMFEEFGRAAVPGPMLSSTIAALAVAEYGTEEQKKALLPGVANGETILAIALSEPEVDYDPKWVSASAVRKDDGFEISGTKLFVPYAHVAGYLLVVARTSGSPGDGKGLTVFIVGSKAPGVVIPPPLRTIAGDKQFEAQLDKAFVSSSDVLGELDKGLPIVEAILGRGAAVLCAQMVGGAQQELEITAEHAKTRVQFERPLGAFQAYQHRMADMFIDVNGARWVTYQAIWRLSEGLPAEREVAVAKAFASAACQRIANSAQHLHGGIGVDVDYDLHYYFRRAKAAELTFGSTPFHLKTIEAGIGE
jgi:alkylation response protein AidB-like acyl-CoA dehydrogenase